MSIADRLPRVALVGRPNVGKSTLFNRLTGRRLAIVHDRPGVTRDRREGNATLGDLEFTVIDTPGLEEARDESLAGRLRAQTEAALAEADLALFLIDARAGVTPLDELFARELRQSGKPTLLLANKCEGRAGAAGLSEAYALALGEPLPVSAEHGEGLADLHAALVPFLRRPSPDADAPPAPSSEVAEDEPRVLRLAIVGRPNVGKSTLVNRLLGEARMLTGPEPGLTRDAVGHAWHHRGRPIELVDTAGLRRRARIEDQVEKLAAASSIGAIRRAHVVLLLLDADGLLDKQDLAIASLVEEEGRALVIGINKWDQVSDPGPALARLRDRIETSLAQLKGVPIATLSARTGRGVDAVIDKAFGAYDVWNRRIPTARLNRWLAEVTERHPPPAVATSRRLRLRYLTQVRSRPPTFALFTQRPDELPESYLRYLVNALREDFDLPGVPIRLGLRKRENPYADEVE